MTSSVPEPGRGLSPKRLFYSVLGLTLSCNRPLPRLAAASAPRGEPLPGEALEIDLETVPFDPAPATSEGWDLRFSSRSVDDHGEPALRIWQRTVDGIYHFSYCDGTDFFIDREGRRVWARWTEPSTLEDAATYLLGPIVGFVLRLRGVVPLHASVVVIDDQAIALAGRTGAGKSTTAAAFAKSGYSVLSDDIAALKPAGNRFLVQVDCPLLRLWPESSEMLWGSREALPRLALDWDKRFLDLDEHGYQGERSPRPLAAVYLLEGEPEPSVRPLVHEVGGRSGLMALIANSYSTAILDARMRAYEFDLLARMFSEVPVRRVHRPETGATPIELCELIVDDFRELRDSPLNETA